MPHDRYFLDTPLTEHHHYPIEGKEWHHLVHVGRASLGKTIELVNGRGDLAQAHVHALHKHSADLYIDHVQTQVDPPPPLILALALSQKTHLEWVIEKGTELNVTTFYLFPGIRSPYATPSPSQILRLHHLMQAAMKQCGRLTLPTLECKPPLLEWAPLKGTLLYGDLSEHTPYLWTIPFQSPLSLPLILFIGPEQGFDSQEVVHLQTTLKATPTRLHPNTLRAETAPLVALSLIQPILERYLK